MAKDPGSEARRLVEAGLYFEAIKLCQPLAESGDLESRSLLGWVYLKGGPSIRKNLDRASSWLAPAAKLGHPSSAYLLGIVCYESGDFSDARQWFEVAARGGYSAGCYQLAKMYQNGFGTEKDTHRANMLYRRAAEMGHLFARREVAANDFRAATGITDKMRAWILLVWAILSGIRTAIADPYDEKTYD